MLFFVLFLLFLFPGAVLGLKLKAEAENAVAPPRVGVRVAMLCTVFKHVAATSNHAFVWVVVGCCCCASLPVSVCVCVCVSLSLSLSLDLSLSLSASLSLCVGMLEGSETHPTKSWQPAQYTSET